MSYRKFDRYDHRLPPTKQKRQNAFITNHVSRFYREAYKHPAYAMRFGRRDDKVVRAELRATVYGDVRRLAFLRFKPKEEIEIGEYSKETINRLAGLLANMTYDEIRREVAGDRADLWKKRK